MYDRTGVFVLVVVAFAEDDAVWVEEADDDDDALIDEVAVADRWLLDEGAEDAVADADS